MIYIESKRRKIERIQKQYPDADILDLTSDSPYRYGQILSPFFPHGNIPVPFSPNVFATCVESIWQGLKVFEHSDVDVSTFQNSSMHNIKRTTRRYGKIKGHQKGIDSTELLDYFQARMLIYLPSYKWVLENVPEVVEIIERIKQRSITNDIVFLDYTTNIDIYNIKKPLSHAGLVKLYIEGKYQDEINAFISQSEIDSEKLEFVKHEQLKLF